MFRSLRAHTTPNRSCRRLGTLADQVAANPRRARRQRPRLKLLLVMACDWSFSFFLSFLIATTDSGGVLW